MFDCFFHREWYHWEVWPCWSKCDLAVGCISLWGQAVRSICLSYIQWGTPFTSCCLQIKMYYSQLLLQNPVYLHAATLLSMIRVAMIIVSLHNNRNLTIHKQMRKLFQSKMWSLKVVFTYYMSKPHISDCFRHFEVNVTEDTQLKVILTYKWYMYTHVHFIYTYEK